MKPLLLPSALAALVLAGAAGSAQAQTELTPLWSVAIGNPSYPYIANDSLQRGASYNPVSGNFIVASRTGGNLLKVLDGTTGAEVGTLDVTGISGGTFPINMVAVADDGAIYAANLVTDSTASPLKVYRWANESATPELVYSGDPSAADPTATNRRFGDTFDVRGSGTSTQIVLNSRAGTITAILSTTDGTTFTSERVATDAAAGDMGLGVAFGDGNTIWTKAPSRNLREISLDLGADTGTTLNNIAGLPASTSALAIDSANNLLALLNYTTHAVLLYDITDPAAPVLLDTESLPGNGNGTFNGNGNGTGAIDFGDGVLYVLDSNNGVAAFTIVPEPSAIALGALGMSLLFLRRRK